MKKIIAQLIVMMLVIVFFAGCIEEEKVTVPDYLPVLINDLESGELIIENEVENFTLVAKYSTDYDATEWRITDSKTLLMQVYAEDLLENATIMIEHMHADISLKSKYAGMDGMLQDSMDDKLHTGEQLGFWITEDYPYENIFAIEGYSQTLIDGWGWMVGSYGSMSIREERLTENNLVDEGGVYGNKIQIVYDILIKYEGEQYYHARSIVNEFLIPLGDTS